MKKSYLHQAGFTLVELLVVISIIGILAGLLLTNFVGIRERAADTRAKNDLSQMKKALRLYYNDYQKYPHGNNQSMYGCGTTGTTVCPVGGEFTAGDPATTYMKQLPKEFSYFNQTLSADYEKYVIFVELQNASDQDITESQTRCASSIADEPNAAAQITDVHYVVCED